MTILCISLIAVIIIGGLVYRYNIKPQLKIYQEKNAEIVSYNQELEEKSQKLSSYNQEQEKISQELSSIVEQLQEKKASLEEDIMTVEKHKNMLLDMIDERFEETLENKAKAVQMALDDYNLEYLQVIQEQTLNFQKENEKLQLIKDDIEKHRKIIKAAIEANKRAELDKENGQKFYMLQLPKESLVEIDMLRSIAPKLKNPEPLNKVIWKYYYEKPYTDLVGRIIGNKTIIGIYKITNTLNNKVYVGQSNDIAARFKQHIKRGLGAEAPTNNKLYPAMLEDGVENFSFELIEECLPTELNEKEKYWQNFFGAKEYGYSIK